MTSKIIQMADYQQPVDYSGIPETYVLYGIIENTLPKDVRKAAEVAIDCHKQSGARPVRPVTLKNAFRDAFKLYATNSGKPVDDACVNKISEFFRLAVCSGIETANKLAEIVGENPRAQDMHDMAHFAKAQRKVNEERRKIGRASRGL